MSTIAKSVIASLVLSRLESTIQYKDSAIERPPLGGGGSHKVASNLVLRGEKFGITNREDTQWLAHSSGLLVHTCGKEVSSVQVAVPLSQRWKRIEDVGLYMLGFVVVGQLTAIICQGEVSGGRRSSQPHLNSSQRSSHQPSHNSASPKSHTPCTPAFLSSAPQDSQIQMCDPDVKVEGTRFHANTVSNVQNKICKVSLDQPRHTECGLCVMKFDVPGGGSGLTRALSYALAASSPESCRPR